jgi:hypothetical protein
VIFDATGSLANKAKNCKFNTSIDPHGANTPEKKITGWSRCKRLVDLGLLIIQYYLSAESFDGSAIEDAVGDTRFPGLVSSLQTLGPKASSAGFF